MEISGTALQFSMPPHLLPQTNGRCSLLALAFILTCCQCVLLTAAVPFGIPPANRTQSCQYGVSLEWTTRVSSSIFATPVIVDLAHDGKKEVLIPTFSQYLEAVNGANGEDVPGYPFVHPKFKSYASPLPVDIDGDGKIEWLVAMYTGELLLFNEEGKARGLLKIPPLAVKKRWMDSRNSSKSAAATALDQFVAVRVKQSRANAQILGDIMRARHMNDLYLYAANRDTGAGTGSPPKRDEESNYVYSPPRQPVHTGVRRAQAAAVDAGAGDDPDVAILKAGLDAGAVRGGANDEQELLAPDVGDDGHLNGAPKEDEFDVAASFNGREGVQPWQEENVELFDVDDDEFFFDGDDAELEHGHRPDGEALQQRGIGPDASLSKAAKASMRLLYHPELYRASTEYEQENDVFGARQWRGKYSVNILPDEIAVDAHILSTPRIVDIDGGGDLDVIVHVSYYFDTEQNSSPLSHVTALPSELNPDDYVATAVVCMNLITGALKWTHFLHLTTKHDVSPAYALSSPLVVNADRKDASLEIYVSSSTGSVVGISSEGKLLPGWPVWLGPIAASPTADNLLGNDELNICVGDVEGKVKCFNSEGGVLWERNVVGGVADHITFGDVNGDGQLDVVFGTSAGLIYALNGATGAPLPLFPVVTRGSIVAPVLLVDLARRRFGLPNVHPAQHSSAYTTEAKYPPLSLVVPSHDGKVYLVHGRDGCIETIDIDEKSSSMVLADDLTGNGRMDLLVTTINGGVYAFETMSEFHPLKVWSSKTKGLNGNSASENNVGIYIAPEYRKPRDIRGDKFRLKVFIEDYRPRMLKARQYAISVYVGTRNRVFHGVFTKAKEISLQLRTPLERTRTSVTVAMTLPNGQVYSDVISLSFNMHFVSTIKYVLLIPFICISCALMFVHKRHEVELSN